jgi:hypothetical protein
MEGELQTGVGIAYVAADADDSVSGAFDLFDERFGSSSKRYGHGTFLF